MRRKMIFGFVLIAAGLGFVVSGWLSDRAEAERHIAWLTHENHYGRSWRLEDGTIRSASTPFKIDDLDPGPPYLQRPVLNAQ